MGYLAVVDDGRMNGLGIRQRATISSATPVQAPSQIMEAK
jgi:hypothetical protein